MKDAGIVTIAAFELRNRLKLISTYVYFLLFAAIGALFMAAAGGVFTGVSITLDSSKVLINSPYAMSVAITNIGFLGIAVMAAMMGRAVQQDFEYRSFPLFFTCPLDKSSYFFGRFTGALLTMLAVYAGIAAGLVAGAYLPGVDTTRLGPLSLREFLQPYVFQILPNLIFLGAMFFGLAAATRRMVPVYVAGVLMFMGYMLAQNLLSDSTNLKWAALIDPVGFTAHQVVVRYWSVAEKNTAFVPLSGMLLWNRLLWLAVGAAVLAYSYRRFSMSQHSAADAAQSPRVHRDVSVAAPVAALHALAPARLEVTALAYLRQLPRTTLLQLRETVYNLYFGVIVLAGILFTLVFSSNLSVYYGTRTYPLTYQLLEVTSGIFTLFLLIITAIYAGELVWRERDAGVDGITDSFPAPDWLGFVAKLITLCLVQALLMFTVFLCVIGLQAAHGYFRFEIGHALYDLFALQLPTYWIIAGLALATQVIVNQKYLGHALVILYFAIRQKLPDYGLDHNLYLLGGTPRITYSDMNGYGHFIAAVRWFQLYWLAFTALLLVVAYLFWVRGKEDSWQARLRVARGRWSAPIAGTAIACAALVAALGIWIFYNTNVLNDYHSKAEDRQTQADYEIRYKKFDGLPQPKIAVSDVNADIFPHEHRLRLHGHYTLTNRTDTPISTLYVQMFGKADLSGQALHPKIDKLAPEAPFHEGNTDAPLGWHPLELETPMQPGASLALDFDLTYAAQGFSNTGANRLVVDNGTNFINDLLPYIGYFPGGELVNDRDRRKFGLAPRERQRDLDDPKGRQFMSGSPDADWIDFHTVVSTDADQIAVAPGYLQRDWTEQGRRYFEYRSEAKMFNGTSFNSARYAVKRAVWDSGQGPVPIEVYYTPGHEFNLDRMIDGARQTLDYGSRNFSPYQFRQLRILEFPRYEQYAQSLANTIPFSEAAGFVAKVDPDNRKDLDTPVYVTAHEVAHQWWGHQVFGAAVQGQPMLTETLAQYTALMVMKKAYGAQSMQRFLRYELDRYLVERGREQKKESPLYRAEGQSYVHYQKGSLVMYALQDAIGEDRVNRALAEYLRKYALKGPPYPTARELLAEFRAVTPPEQQDLITDLFEKITLYENRASSAAYRKLPDGRYAVTLDVFARKLYADGAGAEQQAPMNELVDIGLLDRNDNVILLQKHRIVSGDNRIELVVDQLPAKAGIDPLNILVDRQPSDNVIEVSAQ